jgi:hypothetical protein
MFAIRNVCFPRRKWLCKFSDNLHVLSHADNLNSIYSQDKVMRILHNSTAWAKNHAS